MNLDFSSLNKEQLSAVKAINGPVCVLAGAGSGKTKALTSRIAYMLQLGIKPQNILAITFTNKAAKEMKSRVANLLNNNDISQRISISTFHSLCAKIIRVEIDNIKDLKRNFTIIDDDDQKAIVKTCLTNLNLDEDKFPVKSIIPFISKCKNNLQKYTDVMKIAGNELYLQAYISVYKMYQEDLAYYNRCDFDDLLFHVVDLFKEHPEILERYQNVYQYILIDEYQDTNTAQYALSSLLAKKYKNIFVVGDVDQSIYGFRGSDFSNILHFKNDYPTATIIKLEHNYRSTKTILEAANEVIKNNTERIDKNLWTNEKKDSPIIYKECYNDKEEAQWIIKNIIAECNSGHNRKYKDFAILIRTNALSHSLEDAFVNKNIPYTLVGAKKFYDRKEIKDVLAYMKLLANPSDMLSFKRIINVPKRGIGETSYARIEAYCKQNNLDALSGIRTLSDNNELSVMLPKKAVTSILSLIEQINDFYKLADETEMDKNVFNFLKNVGYIQQYEKGRLEDAEMNKIRLENVYSLLNNIRDYRNQDLKKNEKPKTINDFLEYVSLMSDTDNLKNNNNKVTIMTCHASKGLEFPVVFIAGFEENILPSWQALEEEQSGNTHGIEEERRLCYVAITRAKEQLYVSYATTRQSYNTVKYNPVSRFLEEIPEYLLSEDTESGY